MPVPTPALPPAQAIELPGRGVTWTYDSGDPPGRPRASCLLLLHGWTSTAALNWYRCIPHLREEYRVVALDHRGHGRGLRSRTPFRLEDCADDAAVLLTRMGIDQVVVAGYSMGGPIGQLLWRRHPESVKGLVLCATAAHFDARRQLGAPVSDLVLGASVALSFVPSAVRDWGMGLAARSWGSRQSASEWATKEWSRAEPASLVQAGIALGRFDSRSWIGAVDVPAAVVVTSGDSAVPPERQWELVEAIGGAAGFPVHTDHRGCVNAVDVFVPSLLAACRWADGQPRPDDSALRGCPPEGLSEGIAPPSERQP